jgi:hypothetical protein
VKKMKSLFKLFAISLVLIFAFVNYTFAQYSVSGTVFIKGTNLPVTSGMVNAYRVSDASLIDSTVIHSDGSYMFTALPGELIDVIGPANSEWTSDSPVPTYYPSQQDWASATQIFPNHPLTNININAPTVSGLGGNLFATASITGTVTMNNQPLNDAIIYVKQGELFRAFGKTDSRGQFNIKNVPVGEYTLEVHGMGCNATSTNISLTTKGLNNLNFSLEKASKVQNNSMPQNYNLQQNYPNPFNPVTKIGFSVPKDEYVKLAIYNLAGQLVKELLNEYRQAGNYSTDFDASSLASGVYFYTLSAGNFIQTKKLTLIK